ncbi:MAG: TIGR01212 family radical SAM protein [Longicatena sp.]
MPYHNPFLNSDDNKRYYTWNMYLKHHFHHKVCKVALNASFTCPNRDGTCGLGGCTFCGAKGSGEFAGDKQEDLMKQYLHGIEKMHHKWPNALTMPYFQAFTNTYAPLKELKATFDPFVNSNDSVAICIATRADCLEDDKISYLQSLTKKKEIWIELGLQSIHDRTAEHVHRGHTYQQFEDCVKRLAKTDIKICVHLMNSLPNESADMMIESAKVVGRLPIHALKIHMLYIMKDTQLAKEYETTPFPILTKEEYIAIVIKQLEWIPKEIIIQRLTGDGVKEDLITPSWTIKKTCVLNDIDKEMVRLNTWQGKKC